MKPDPVVVNYVKMLNRRALLIAAMVGAAVAFLPALALSWDSSAPNWIFYGTMVPAVALSVTGTYLVRRWLDRNSPLRQ